MKTSALVHVVWLLVAGAAFGIGWSLRPGGDQQATSGPSAGGIAPGIEGGSTNAPAAGNSAAGGSKDADRAATSRIAKYIDGNGVIRAKDMGRAMRDAMRESDPVKSALLFAELLQELTGDNIDEALAALDESPAGMEKWQKMGLFVSAWGKVDGAKAVGYAKELPPPGNIFGTAAALSGWATKDADAAQEWLSNSDLDGRTKVAATAGILRGLASADADKATEYLQSLPENTAGMEQLVGVVAGEQMKRGQDTATQWAAELSTDGLKEQAFRQLANEYAVKDPVQASTWIEEYAGDKFSSRAVEEVADEWAEVDPAAAVKWSEKLPEATQTVAMKSAFEEWAESDPTTASEHLISMEQSPAKDSAIAGFVSDLGKEDPASAIQWAESIQDTGVRTAALTDVASDWFQTDREAATEWLPNSGLPAEAVEKITTPPNQMADMLRRFGGGGGFGR